MTGVQRVLFRSMVHSIRFWADVFGLFSMNAKQIEVTEFGEWLLNPDSGFDPYLDTKDSLWLLHWRLCFKARLGAWHVLFYGGKSDIRGYDFIKEVSVASGKTVIAKSTVKQHISVLMSTYTILDKGKEIEDNALMGQMVPLGLVDTLPIIGDNQIRIVSDAADEISSYVWAIIFLDFLKNAAPGMETMSKSFLENHPQSPVKAIPVSAVALSKLLFDVEKITRGAVNYVETLDEQLIQINNSITAIHSKVVPNGY